MTTRTPQEIDAMEQEVRDYREAERLAAEQALRDAAALMIDLLGAGTLQQVLDALAPIDAVPAGVAERYPALRSGANALREGLESVMQAVRSLPAAEA